MILDGRTKLDRFQKGGKSFTDNTINSTLISVMYHSLSIGIVSWGTPIWAINCRCRQMSDSCMIFKYWVFLFISKIFVDISYIFWKLLQQEDGLRGLSSTRTPLSTTNVTRWHLRVWIWQWPIARITAYHSTSRSLCSGKMSQILRFTFTIARSRIPGSPLSTA